MDMVNVASETGHLKRLIVHRPDRGIECITPDKATEWLYEDIVFLEKMQEEHDVFTQLISYFIGKENVIDIQTLLSEVLKDEGVRKELLKQVGRLEHCVDLERHLHHLSSDQIAFTLVTGILWGTADILFPPVSNFIFCRDIAAVINDNILITQACKKARARESILTRAILKFSALFDQCKLIQLSTDEELLSAYERGDNLVSIEGGDVMVFDHDHVLIGCSERTSREAIERLTHILFERGIVKSVVHVELPKERYCMHLDTIFTLIDKNDCVVFDPLIQMEDKMKVIQHKADGSTNEFKSLKAFVCDVYPTMNFISCGNGQTPHDAREQWTDGCNLFALKPGVAVTYDRNVRTAHALVSNGYRIVDAVNLLSDFAHGVVTPDAIEKTIILISSNELSRARGGTHCLTLPLWREL